MGVMYSMVEIYRRLFWVGGDFSESFREDLFGNCNLRANVPDVKGVQGSPPHCLHVI